MSAWIQWKCLYEVEYSTNIFLSIVNEIKNKKAYSIGMDNFFLLFMRFNNILM